MILRALHELAHTEHLVVDPDFVTVPVAWLVRVAGGGRILGIEGTHYLPEMTGKKKAKPVAKNLRIRRQPGRSGTKAPAAFLVDNAKYVFGLPTADKAFSVEEGREKSSWFRRQVAECVDATGDEGARAVLDALESVSNGAQTVTLPEECASNELFAFVYAPDDVPVHERPAVREYWHARRRAETDRTEGGGAGRFECLVTGQPMGAPGNFPKVKRVPGGQSSGVPLVAFNASAFESYGLASNENAPFSREAAEACATALERLIHPAFPSPDPARRGETLPRRSIRLSEDTAACYWSAGGGDAFLDSLLGLLESADAEIVGEMYRSVGKGRPVDVPDAGRF